VYRDRGHDEQQERDDEDCGVARKHLKEQGPRRAAAAEAKLLLMRFG
jgi:hypothetical protein